MGDSRKLSAWPLRWLRALTHALSTPLQSLPAPWTLVVEPIEGGEENLLHKSQLREPLQVNFDLWQFSFPTPGSPDVLELFFDTLATPVARKTWTAPINTDDLWILLDARFLTAGRHTLRYVVTLGASGASSNSDSYTFLVDPTVPELDEDDDRLVFPAAALAGITQYYLEANDDKVLANLPDYWPIRVGDVIAWYWETRAEGMLTMGSRTLRLSEVGLPLTILCPGDLIRMLGDGARYATYDVTSRAGYKSQLSRYVLLDVDTTPVPRHFPPPTLAYLSGAPVSGTLDPLQALQGVNVLVPAAAVFYEGEVAQVQWAAGTTLGSTEVNVPISGVGPWYGLIDAQYIGAHMGKSVAVRYRLLGDDDLAPSSTLTLYVSGIEPNRFPKVESKAAKANPGIVSLARVPAEGDELKLPRWPLIAGYHRIRLSVDGTLGNGIPATQPLLQGSVLTPGQLANGIRELLPRTWLARLRPLSNLTLRASVSFDGGQSWTVFPPTYLQFTL